MSEELWEEYKNKLVEINDNWNFIDALIYRYKSPDNLPIEMWMTKLENNPNYWEETVNALKEKSNNDKKFDIVYEKIDLNVNVNDFNIESRLETLLLFWDRVISNLMRLDKKNWKYFTDSKPILALSKKAVIEISQFNAERIQKELNISISRFQELTSETIKKVFEKLLIKNSLGEQYEIELQTASRKNGIYFEELVTNPQIFYPFNADKEVASWEYQYKGFDRTLHSLNLRIDRWQKKYALIQQKKIDSSRIDIEYWFTTPYAVIENLLLNKFDEISELPEEVLNENLPKQKKCKWFIQRKWLENKSCSSISSEYDIFCSWHIEINDDISKNLRNLIIERESQKNPTIDVSIIKIKYAYPTQDIIDLRKKINNLRIDYYFNIYPKLIHNDSLRIERWKLQKVFFEALKPLYEKYHYYKFGRPTMTMSKKLRIMKKSNFKCALCKAELTEKEPHIDHIIPLVKGGGNSESNLQALCWECNLKKGSKILNEKTE